MFPRSVILTSSPDQNNLLFLFKPILPTTVVSIHCDYKLNNSELSLSVIWTVSSNGHCAIIGGVISVGKTNDFKWVKKAIKGLGGRQWDNVVIGGYDEPEKHWDNYALSTWHLYLEVFNELRTFAKDPNQLYDQFKKLINTSYELEFEDNWTQFLNNFEKLQKPQLEYLDQIKSKKERW